jgi:hypothetical protein
VAIEARAVMYADQMGECRTLQVVDAAGEKRAIAERFSRKDGTRQPSPRKSDTYPKTRYHPDYSTGAPTGYW